MTTALRRAAIAAIAAIGATLFIAPAASAATDGDWEYTNLPFSRAAITGYTGAGGAVEIPDTLGGRDVVRINSGAFSDDTITSLTFASTELTTIQSGVFQGQSFTTVALPESVTVIGEEAFEGGLLQSVTMGPGILIGMDAFANNAISSLSMTDGTSWLNGYGVGEGAFSGNALTSVAIPDYFLPRADVFADNHLESATLPANISILGPTDPFNATSQTRSGICASSVGTGWFDATQPAGTELTPSALDNYDDTIYIHWDMVAVTLSAPSTTYTSTTLCVPTGTAPDLTGVELPEKTGHTLLDEWLDSEDNTYLLTDTFDQDVELFAQFEANDYTVTFDPATDADAPLDVTVTYGDTVADPGHPDWDLHVFQAWVDDAETPWDFSTPVEGDMTLTGTWCERSVVAPASVHQGEVLEITGSCFEPGESVTFTLNSDPLALGTVTADADGMVTVSATIPVEFATGAHSVTVVGDATGTSTVDVEVLAVLPPTGFGSAGIAAGAAGLLVAGALVLGLRRRALA